MAPGPPVRLAELEPGHLASCLAFLMEEIGALVAREPGVLALSAVALRDRPSALRLLEVQADEAAYRAHLGSPRFLRYKESTLPMVCSLRLLEADPVALRAKRAGDAGAD